MKEKSFKDNEQKYVQLHNCGESEIFLGGTVVNNDVKYLVDAKGKISYHEKYEDAMADFVKACFKKRNGVDTFID